MTSPTALEKALAGASVEFETVADSNLPEHVAELEVYTVTSTESRVLMAVVGKRRFLDLDLVEEALARTPVPDQASPTEGLDRAANMAHWIASGWPAMVDRRLANDDRPLRLPSGRPGESVLLLPQALVEALGARIEPITGARELARAEPHYVLYEDGIRSLREGDDHLLVPPIEVYFPEVRQLVTDGEPDDVVEAFDRMVAATKELLPRPPAQEIADARYAFLKER